MNSFFICLHLILIGVVVAMLTGAVGDGGFAQSVSALGSLLAGGGTIALAYFAWKAKRQWQDQVNYQNTIHKLDDYKKEAGDLWKVIHSGIKKAIAEGIITNDLSIYGRRDSWEIDADKILDEIYGGVIKAEGAYKILKSAGRMPAATTETHYQITQCAYVFFGVLRGYDDMADCNGVDNPELINKRIKEDGFVEYMNTELRPLFERIVSLSHAAE